jgi:hypothetical protein
MTMDLVDPIVSKAEKVRHERPESAIILKRAAQMANTNMNKWGLPNLVVAT